MRFAVAIFVCSSALADKRTFRFAHIEEPRHMQEVVNTIRSIAEAQEVTADPERRAVTVGGSAERLAAVAWLFAELDRPASPPSTLLARDRDIADARAPAVKVLSPAHVREPLKIQELVNAVRSLTDLQRVVAVSGPVSIIARGSPAQVALAEWITREVDEAAAKSQRGMREYAYADDLRLPEHRTPAVRIYYPARMTTPLELQESVNVLRVIAEIQRVVAFTVPPAIVIRGGDEHARLGDWLIGRLDEGAGPVEYVLPGRADGLVKVAFLPTAVDLVATWERLRQRTGMPRIVPMKSRQALVVRGTAADVAAFEQALR